MGETGETPDRLRDALVDALRGEGGVPFDRRVESALRAVPRHVFVPEATLAAAYENQPIVTKKDAAGLSVSSISQPSIVAIMLDQLDVAEGHRVLEIGAGTGYNAALLRHLVGPSGAVTTVDIDADIVERARRGLAAAGCADVGVHVADGWHGWAADAPYDRIILTVGAADLSPVWWDQLSVGGVLVLPLQLRGSQRSIAFERADGYWESRSVTACGFIPMRGAGAKLLRNMSLVEGGTSLWADPGQSVDVDGLRAALALPDTHVSTGLRVTVAEVYDPVDLLMALRLDGFGRVDNREPDPRITPAMPWGSPALIDRDSFAYLSRDDPPSDDPGADFALGVRGHGPRGAQLAADVADLLREWDRDRDALLGLRIRAYPAGTEIPPAGPGDVNLAHSRLVLGWPAGSDGGD